MSPRRSSLSARQRTPVGALALGALRLLAAGLVATAAGAEPDAAAAPAGDVRIELVFGEQADLDLFVTDPMHEEVYFANPRSRLGGVFEADRRCGDPAPRVESVRFSPAPAGRYRVSVDFPIRCRDGIDAVPYRVIVDVLGERRQVEGTAHFGRLEQRVLEFEVQARGAGSSR
jgi:hypothetical protein